MDNFGHLSTYGILLYRRSSESKRKKYPDFKIFMLLLFVFQQNPNDMLTNRIVPNIVSTLKHLENGCSDSTEPTNEFGYVEGHISVVIEGRYHVFGR